MAQSKLQTQKIKSIKRVGKLPVYDISVKDKEHYILENGIITHNTGSYYSADNIFIIGRQQEKEGTEIVGYNFIINVEKSRYVKEKSKIPITVSFEGGVSRYSGLIEIALESGHVVKPNMGWYAKANPETGEVEEKKYRLKDTFSSDFWDPILNDESFNKFIEKRYAVSHGKIIQDEDDSIEVYENIEDEE